MTFFSDATIEGFRQLQRSAMMDECELLTRLAGGEDQYNMPEPDSYVWKATLPCLFRPIKATEVLEGAEVPTLDAMISFTSDVEEEYGVELTSLDRIKVTKLHGDEVAPVIYEIVGDLKRDSVAIVAELKKTLLPREIINE